MESERERGREKREGGKREREGKERGTREE
jgi:hypothetical protein